MPHNLDTGVFTVAVPDAQLLDPALNIFDFVFPHTDEPQQRKRKTWLIEAETGRTLTQADAYERTLSIARGFDSLGLGPGRSMVIYSPNDVCATALVLTGCAMELYSFKCIYRLISRQHCGLRSGWEGWSHRRVSAVPAFSINAAPHASHPASRPGFILDPSYTASELAFQIKLVHEHYPVEVVLVHPDSLHEAIEACNQSGVSSKLIVLIRPPGTLENSVLLSVPPTSVLPS